MADLKEIAVAITHGAINLPYNLMPRFKFDLDQILLDEYVGQWLAKPTVVSKH